MRKQAEALEFPWHRQLDFNKLRAEANWDDSAYDKDVLDGMAVVREQNMPIITKLDEELTEKQRQQRTYCKALKSRDHTDTLDRLHSQ